MKRQFLKICTLKIDDETKSPKSKLKKGGIIYLDSNKGDGNVLKKMNYWSSVKKLCELSFFLSFIELLMSSLLL